MNPNIILASFAARLGASPILIGLVPALPLAGGLLPQALLVGWVARHRKKLPLYRKASAFRFAGLLLLVFGAFFLGAWPGLLLGVFLAGLFLFALFTALASLPYWEVLAKAVPREERPGLFAAIYMGGGVLAFLAGFGVRALLGLDLPFPLGYALLFALGTLAYGAAWYVFGRVEEPEEEVAVGRTDLRLPLRRPGVRAYLTARLFLGLAGMVEPFYAAYAVRVLGKEAELGLYLALNALAFILSNALWSALARRGAKAVFLGGGVLVLATPLLALALPPGAFALVFFLQGAYLAALGIAGNTYLLNLAPPEERTATVGLANSFLGLFAFSPVLGGWVVGAWGYQALFLLSAGLAVLGLWAVRRLPEV